MFGDTARLRPFHWAARCIFVTVKNIFSTSFTIALVFLAFKGTPKLSITTFQVREHVLFNACTGGLVYSGSCGPHPSQALPHLLCSPWCCPLLVLNCVQRWGVHLGRLARALASSGCLRRPDQCRLECVVQSPPRHSTSPPRSNSYSDPLWYLLDVLSAPLMRHQTDMVVTWVLTRLDSISKVFRVSPSPLQSPGFSGSIGSCFVSFAVILKVLRVLKKKKL